MNGAKRIFAVLFFGFLDCIRELYSSLRTLTSVLQYDPIVLIFFYDPTVLAVFPYYSVCAWYYTALHIVFWMCFGKVAQVASVQCTSTSRNCALCIA